MINLCLYKNCGPLSWCSGKEPKKWVPSLGREDTLEWEMATNLSVIAWKISWTEEPGKLQSMTQSRTRLSD